MIRVGFFGTPSLSARVLEDLLQAHDIEMSFVVTNPDKPIGRSNDLQESPVKKVAKEYGIPVLQPLKIRDNYEFLDTLRTYECEYFIVVAYGKILPEELLDIPKKMCINIHGSVLPKYRGASPIQSALLHGETETGVTIMRMSAGMDEGDILAIEKITIDQSETSGTLFEKFAQISGRVLMETLVQYEKGDIVPIKQGDWIPAYAGMTGIEYGKAPEISYCKKIEKEDGLIDWSRSAEKIYRMWQAYTPWPGIYTMYEGKRLILESVSLPRHSDEGRIQDRENKDTGSFVPQDDEKKGCVTRLQGGSIGVICGEGVLTLEQVKLEGKRSQSIEEFVRGRADFIGYTL